MWFKCPEGVGFAGGVCIWAGIDRRPKEVLWLLPPRPIVDWAETVDKHPPNLRSFVVGTGRRSDGAPTLVPQNLSPERRQTSARSSKASPRVGKAVHHSLRAWPLARGWAILASEQTDV